MALQSSQRLPELLFYTKKSYRILQLQFYKGTHPSTYNLHVHITLQYIQRILHPKSYMQKTRSSSSTTTTYRGQRDLHSRFQKRNSTHRRQGDLLEIHPCVLQDIPGIPATRPSKGIQSFQSFQTFQSFMTFQPFQAILQIL